MLTIITMAPYPQKRLPVSRFFANVNSCTPTLKWEASQDAGATYDIVIFRALTYQEGFLGPKTLPIQGELIVSETGLKTPSYTVQKTLRSKTEYLWSVRTHFSDGRVSQWLSYDRHGSLLTMIDQYNIWPGIQTPECPPPALPPYQDIVKVYKGSDLNDESMASMLKSGYGGVIVWNRNYECKKDAINHISQYKNIFEWAEKETVVSSKPTKKLNLLMMPAENKTEVELSPNDRSVYVMVGPPGDYFLTRWMIQLHEGKGAERIASKVTIEAGKIKYIGDVVTFSKPGSIWFEEVLEKFMGNFDESVFLPWVKKAYPKMSPYVVPENIFNPPEKEEKKESYL
ncbi:MAG: hypothetical protein IPJ69_00285 [Deltaproteobacteria bacterium]|nr:MAG: hypothetical protein IPJ69_00285 [Deltaproteobacteria bacterium]